MRLADIPPPLHTLMGVHEKNSDKATMLATYYLKHRSSDACDNYPYQLLRQDFEHSPQHQNVNLFKLLLELVSQDEYRRMNCNTLLYGQKKLEKLPFDTIDSVIGHINPNCHHQKFKDDVDNNIQERSEIDSRLYFIYLHTCRGMTEFALERFTVVVVGLISDTLFPSNNIVCLYLKKIIEDLDPEQETVNGMKFHERMLCSYWCMIKQLAGNNATVYVFSLFKLHKKMVYCDMQIRNNKSSNVQFKY